MLLKCIRLAGIVPNPFTCDGHNSRSSLSSPVTVLTLGFVPYRGVPWAVRVPRVVECLGFSGGGSRNSHTLALSAVDDGNGFRAIELASSMIV